MSIGEEKKTRVNMKAKRYWGKAVSFPNKVEKERAIRLSPPPSILDPQMQALWSLEQDK